MNNNSALKIHPTVESLIGPIITDITNINLIEKANPNIGPHNEPQAHKERKKACVHILRDEQGGYCIKTTKDPKTGKMICEGCGRIINTTFDDSAVDKISDCIEVINQIVLFGTINGLKAEPLAAAIDVKTKLPGLAQILKELNMFVKRDDAATDSERKIGEEYQTPSNVRSITRM